MGRKSFHRIKARDGQDLLPGEVLARIPVEVEREDGSRFTFSARSRLDTPIDVRYYQNGGILHTVLRDLLHKSAKN